MRIWNHLHTYHYIHILPTHNYLHIITTCTSLDTLLHPPHLLVVYTFGVAVHFSHISGCTGLLHRGIRGILIEGTQGSARRTYTRQYKDVILFHVGIYGEDMSAFGIAALILLGHLQHANRSSSHYSPTYLNQGMHLKRTELGNRRFCQSGW